MVYEEGEEPIKIFYVRYADDFLIGVNGSKQLAKLIYQEVCTFVKSSLHFKVSKNEIAHARSS